MALLGHHTCELTKAYIVASAILNLQMENHKSFSFRLELVLTINILVVTVQKIV